MYQIAVLAPDYALYHTSLALKDSVKYPLIVLNPSLDNVQGASNDAIESGARIIISRGSMAAKLAELQLPIPLLTLPILDYELTYMLLQAKEISERISVIALSDEFLARVLKISANLNIVVTQYLTSLEADSVEKTITTAVQNGAEVIVGGGYLGKYANHFRIPFILVHTNAEILRSTLKEAENILDSFSAERTWSEKVHAMFNSVSMPLLAVDKNGLISDSNVIANKMFEIRSGQTGIEGIVGNSVAEILREHESCRNVEFKYKNSLYSLDSNPIWLDREYIGAMISIQSDDSVRLSGKSYRGIRRNNFAKYTFSDIVTNDDTMRQTIQIAKKYAQTESTIMICGESGCGKELMAQSIHNYSLRSKNPFVALNCAALPESLIESELFGYVEGAFTGAQKSGKAGLFELANSGTLFLDEISEISLSTQAKLLRAIEEKEIIRLGDSRPIPIDVRIISSSNQDLLQMVRDSRFRNDLYYRLNVLQVDIPPLRKRIHDIPLLYSNLYSQLNSKNSRTKIPSLSPAALEMLQKYPWYGNVRELRNLVERINASCSSDPITANDLIPLLNNSFYETDSVPDPVPTPKRPHTLKEEEALLILDALKQTGGNKAEAAVLLGMSKTTLWRRLKELGHE